MDALTRLAIAARDGDREATEAFVRAAQTPVWRFCAAVDSAEHADDLTQDTLLRALGAVQRFEGRSSARTWLLGIARRTVADDIRRRVRRRRLVDRLADDHAARSGHVVDDVESSDRSLLDLVATLGPDRRDAFVLTQILGLDYAEAAEVCRCPVGTIRSRVSRARQDLAARVDADDRGRVTG